MAPTLTRQRSQNQVVDACVIESRAKHLAAGDILVGSRYATSDTHIARVDRQNLRQPGERIAIGAYEEDGFHQIATCLLDRERGKVAIVQRTLGHYTVDRKRHLFSDLIDGEFRDGCIAAPLLRQQLVSVLDGDLAAFDCCNIG